MRYLVLSDIHANLDALDAALAKATSIGYDRLLVLGDLVGYGAQPNEVVDRIRALRPFAIIRGNHDRVASGVEDAEGFNPIAQEAAEWTYRTLTPDNRAYLSACPAGPVFVDAATEICHGSPDDEDVYITSELAALHALKEAQRPICFYGHTHIPVAFRMTDTAFELIAAESADEQEILVERGSQYLINPGSVGQPRDGDPRASFAMFEPDSARVVLYRIAYPIERAQEKILRAGLPQTLARRLAIGR